MVKINKNELSELQSFNKALKLAIERQELEQARMTAFVLGAFDKYKIDRQEYGLNPETGEFVKKQK